MSELSLMITVCEQSMGKRFRALYDGLGAGVHFSAHAHGTATSKVLSSFGLERSDKTVIHTMIENSTFPKVKQELERRFLIHMPGVGVVFTIPLSSIGGKRQLRFLLDRQEFQRGEETELKSTAQELIIIIANQGYTEIIMDAARSAGAGGGTVIHAKGTGMAGSEKFFGFVLAEEKEMIYIVVPTHRKDAVMRAVMDEAGIKKEAQAICFSLPVTDTAGMRLPLESENGGN